MNTYVVATNTAVTSIVVAKSEEEAIRMTLRHSESELGESDYLDIEAYEINDYFANEYTPRFFGWVVNSDHNYL